MRAGDLDYVIANCHVRAFFFLGQDENAASLHSLPWALNTWNKRINPFIRPPSTALEDATAKLGHSSKQRKPEGH